MQSYKQFERDFGQELERKERLSDLLYELEDAERERMEAACKKDRAIEYTRMFKGVAVVTKKKGTTVRLRRQNGRAINLEVTPQINALLRENDELFLIAALYQNLWRLISLQGIGSHLSDAVEMEDSRAL